ncbi:MAG: anti-sigma factor [Terriglobales bacterium]
MPPTPPDARVHNLGWSWTLGPAAIALGLLCLVLLGRVAGLSARGRVTETQLATAQRQTQAALAQNRNLRFAATLLADPATLSLPVRAVPTAPQGRAYLNPTRGAVIVASHLPPAPSGRTYEMWLLPGHGNPLPAGVFQATAAGDAVHAIAQPLHDIAGLAVSLEPAPGSSQPTGPIVLAAKLP